VPGLSASTVPGHAGRFVLTRVNGKPVLIIQAGLTMPQVGKLYLELQEHLKKITR